MTGRHNGCQAEIKMDRIHLENVIWVKDVEYSRMKVEVDKNIDDRDCGVQSMTV